MAINRYIPYGYIVNQGQIKINENEACIVRRIYSDYAAGQSYKKIAEMLTAEGIRYMPQKPVWNKNMVARILQNQNYLGNRKFPAILDSNLYKSVELVQKPYNLTEPEAIRVLKNKLVCTTCGGAVKRRIKSNSKERWYCENSPFHVMVSITDESLMENFSELQNTLLTDLDALTSDIHSIDISAETIRLQNEIDALLCHEEIDSGAIQKAISQLAEKRYALVEDNTAQETIWRERLSQSGTELNYSLLAEITSQIKVNKTEAVELVLKNGKVIRKGDAQNDKATA